MSAIGSTSASLFNFSGLSSGLNTNQIVTQLMQLNAIPQNQLKTTQQQYQVQSGAYQALSTSMAAVGTAADNLTLPSDWEVFAAASSNSQAMTATAGAGAVSGSLDFTIANLATSASVISTASVASTSANVASGNLLLSEAGGLGFSAVSGSAGLATGSHTLTVVTATTAATATGSSALAGSTTITAGSNDTLTYTLDGQARTLTIPAGTYSSSQLAAAVAGASGGKLTGLVNGSGQLAVSSTAEGSAHSLTITGGNAIGALGLTAGASGTGTDGSVALDGGTAVTVSDTASTTPLTLTAPNGQTVSVTPGGGALTAGSSTVTNVSTATGSLSDVVNAINQSGAGLTAAAVQVSPGAYRLQINASTTGTASAVTIDPAAFQGTLGALQVVTAGQNATVSVGTGPGAYQLQSASNSVTGLLPGVAINLLQASSTPVTVSVSPDANALAAKVSGLISAVNTVISQANFSTAFDPQGTNTGPLIGDLTTERMPGLLQQAVSSAVTGANLHDASAVGITVNSDGTLAFNQATFMTALQTDPAAVQDLFNHGTGASATGIAQRLSAAAHAATASGTGYLSAAITASQSEITSLGTQIDAWTPILAEQQQALLQQFTAMETALSQLKAQSAAMGAAFTQLSTPTSTGTTSSATSTPTSTSLNSSTSATGA